MKPLILYFYPNKASYVEKDLYILGKKYRIIKHCVNPSSKLKLPFSIIYQKLLCLRCFKAKYIVCQFAGYHSLLPVVMGKILKIKSLIILGGSDCSSFPEINYGNYRKPLLGWFTAKSIEMADIISPVHEKMIFYRYEYENFSNKNQGFEAFTKVKNQNIKVIYNGFSTGFFKNLNLPREKNFIAIATYNRPAVYYLKGIDLIEKAANEYKNINFTVVGVSDKYLKSSTTENLIFLPFLKQEELVKLLNRHYFYMQLSISEGFPNALCEAMLCACIPIVSNVCSMPDIIGNTGFVLQKRDEKLLFNLIEKVLSTPNLDKLSSEASKRVTENFSIEKRETELLKLLD
ncbi:MAG: glycosyltransferase family 4 protein [Bacteroidetes bacterium]|nr:glycosyltransferase family 4 protein [Bacteroidota bacterium]